MNEKKLSVKMFGGFSASYGEEVLTFGRQRDSKFCQLFQILMTRPGQGFSKSDIAERLYGWERVEDPNASLNNTIFRLRKYLETSPLPAGDYLSLSGGVLRFEGEAESDVWLFESLARKFEEEQDRYRKAVICEEACERYQGEFLPWLANEQWVIEKSRDYEKLYFQMVRYLLDHLKEEGEHRRVQEVAARAVQFYPYGGWEAWQIDSLIALGLHEEAEAVYQRTVSHMQGKGSFLSRKQQEQFREIGGRIRKPEGTREDIVRSLMEDKPGQGAYACTLPGFSDCFRMLKRVTKRGTVHFSLLLCTILDGNGHPANNREYCEKQGRRLCASFRKYLRQGDIYTKYSESQYLLLCAGAAKENIPEIGARIDRDFRKRCGGRGGISCRLLDEGEF